MDAILELFKSLPPTVVYAVLGVGAALENIIPPIPADTFVLLGGLLAASGLTEAWVVWAVTCSCNVGSALAVYAAGYRYGPTFFEDGLGRWILTARQMERVQRFYTRFGVAAIFLTRFLPGLRAVVPAFAGVTRQRLAPVALPLVAASALWYGGLVWLGAFTGRNLDGLVATVGRVSGILLFVALVIGAVLVWWWLETRRDSR